MKGEKAEADYYFNEKGLLVFTESYHLKRGFCCGSSCKHCPFDHINVLAKKNTTDGRTPESAS